MAFDAGTLGVKASLAEPAGATVEGTPFVINKKAVFLALGIIPANRPSLDNALAGQLIDGSEVTDVRIRVRTRWTDLLVSLLTAGMVIPRSVTFEGVVVHSAQ